MNITSYMPPPAAIVRRSCAECGGHAPKPVTDQVELSGAPASAATGHAATGMAAGLIAAGPPPGGHMGVHGMLVFGDRFFSHIPMFHVPHDYQIVMDVKLSTPDVPKDRLHTFVPDRFSLGDLLNGTLTKFEGTLYEGNFETPESKVVAEHVQAEVREILRSEHLDPKSQGGTDLEYTLYGTPQEAYLLHRISGDADFDQLLAGKVEGLSPQQLAQGVTVTVPGHANRLESRLLADRQPVAAQVDGQPVTLQVDRELSILLGPGFDHGPGGHGGHGGH